eukprot:CAMPEP_0206625292 /NCGR_PEP_ID=MMETSP0325_2-20121206/64666_1 /ASSEMBLY_ACC=CAM_ASM_000347 /TAXON_ID=2866 /ORGANISM="Crypthecodinium cohnii, Strain Seligo" /LENGTH=89 /DNA_ID=CAMNT_0054149483 /DNA_START=478 /DNA_END=747 /DNA_ORIENTATION=-
MDDDEDEAGTAVGSGCSGGSRGVDVDTVGPARDGGEFDFSGSVIAFWAFRMPAIIHEVGSLMVTVSLFSSNALKTCIAYLMVPCLFASS